MMNLSQTKLVGLTMKLDLKAREYNKLCDKLEQLKQTNINPNDDKLLELKKLFQKNQNEIVEINKRIRELKEQEETIEKQKLEQYDASKLFNKASTNASKILEDEKTDIAIVENKKGIFQKLIEKIKKIFRINNR